MVQVVHCATIAEVLAAYRDGEILEASATGRIVQLGRSAREAKALVSAVKTITTDLQH